MNIARGMYFDREKIVIVAMLAMLSGVAWVLTVSQMGSITDMALSVSTVAPDTGQGGMSMPMVSPNTGSDGMPMDEVLASEPGTRLIIYLGMWVTMMTAMMLPAAVPMVLTFATVAHGQRERESAFVPTWVFVAGYLAVWAGLGAIAWAVGETGLRLVRTYPALGEFEPRLAALAMVGAGLYQLTPLKHRCLSHCRSPLTFVHHRWRSGMGGAWQMGLDHGRTCVGCCWVLFALLVAVGLASLPWMVLITLIILAEKLLPGRKIMTVSIAVLLFGLGLFTLVRPDLLALASG